LIVPWRTIHWFWMMVFKFTFFVHYCIYTMVATTQSHGLIITLQKFLSHFNHFPFSMYMSSFLKVNQCQWTIIIVYMFIRFYIYFSFSRCIRTYEIFLIYGIWIKKWLNYSFDQSICHEISVWSSNFFVVSI